MIASYFRIALRNLLRNRSYAIINVSGIAVGMTAFALIAFYIFDELSYDRFNKKADRVVRVVHHAAWDGNEVHHAVTSAAFAPALKSTFPEVEHAVRIVPEGGGIISYNDKVVAAGGIMFADKEIFDVFTLPFLYGDSSTALSMPQSIVLTETLAKKLFDDPKDALNQTIYFDGNYSNKVTGVMKDVPSNSTSVSKHCGRSTKTLPTNGQLPTNTPICCSRKIPTSKHSKQKCPGSRRTPS